jgi:hypothetical protein
MTAKTTPWRDAPHATSEPAHAIAAALNTACPPRRSFVASDARRRGQACRDDPTNSTAFGAALPTAAILAAVDNADQFTLIADT